jgi:hypothetical protein
MVKEVLCNVPRHDNCCLLQSRWELGTELVFWENGPGDNKPDVLPLARPG